MTENNRYDGQKTSYKIYSKPKLKKYKNTTVIPTINAIMSYIERIALGRIEWEGIDGNGIAKSNKVEEYLYYFLRCGIVDTKEVGLAVVKLVPMGINIYGEPASYKILTSNGMKLTPKDPPVEVLNGMKLDGDVTNSNAIILTDSQLIGRGCINGVWHWVEKIADAQISLDQQMINQRSPTFAFTKEKNEEATARLEVIDVHSGLNALMIDEKMKGNLQALNLNSQFNVDKIINVQHEYLNHALDSLGVDSLQSFGKKERLLEDEIESNDESLSMILSDMLKARQKPLIKNPIAEEYGITCKLAKPYRISTYKENHVDYSEIVKNPDEPNQKETIESDIND